jgi:hypothetical protein
MPGLGPHRFEFAEKEPLVFRVVVALLFLNTFLLLLLAFGTEHLFPKASPNLRPCAALAQNGVQYHAPDVICWYASRSIAIQFVILALGAAILIIFRKRVRYYKNG